MNGWIKLYRSFLDWEWHDDYPTAWLFLHMILLANIRETSWHGYKVERGSFISSRRSLAKITGLSEHQVRVALEHLKMTGEVASSATPKFTVFTIKNYDKYQRDDPLNDQQMASNVSSSMANKWPSDGQVVATAKEGKEEKEVKKEEGRRESGRFAPPTLEAVRQYCLERKNRVDPQRFVDYYEANGWRVGRNPMRDWKAAVRSWETNGRDTSRRQVGPNGVELTGETTDILDGIL